MRERQILSILKTGYRSARRQSSPGTHLLVAAYAPLKGYIAVCAAPAHSVILLFGWQYFLRYGRRLNGVNK